MRRPHRAICCGIWILAGIIELAGLSAGSATAIGPATDPSGARETSLRVGLAALSKSSFKRKLEAVAQIGASGAKRSPEILESLLAGRLYVHRPDRRIVERVPSEAMGPAEEPEDGASVEAQVLDPVSGDRLSGIASDDLKKIIINNKMRVRLRRELAAIRLRAPDRGVRAIAAKALLSELDVDTVAMLQSALIEERDADVQALLRLGLELSALDSEDVDARIEAARSLSGSLHNEVRNRLVELRRELESEIASVPESGEPDVAGRDELLGAVEASLRSIDLRRSLWSWVETIFFGMSLGSVLVLAAIGLSITFGVMGVINMAHGELIMLGAYTTWVVQQVLPEGSELSLVVAVPCAFVVSGGAGIAIERGVVRHLYGRPLETLLATFGVSLILQQAVRTVFSPLNRAVTSPEWMSGQWVVNDAFGLTLNRVCIIAFSISVFFVLVGVLNFTRFGLEIRAVAQNRDMARAMGVRGAWVDAGTFGLGAGVAGLAGVALSQLTNVGPNLGQAHIVDSFMVVVFGGVGNLWGTLVGGLSLGVANKFLEPFVGAVLAKILVLLFIILFIQRRPRGLFPQHGRSAEAR